jgi:hypothetical protein
VLLTDLRDPASSPATRSTTLLRVAGVSFHAPDSLTPCNRAAGAIARRDRHPRDHPPQPVRDLAPRAEHRRGPDPAIPARPPARPGNLTGLRAISAVAMALATGLLVLIARKLDHERAGYWATGVLVASPPPRAGRRKPAPTAWPSSPPPSPPPSSLLRCRRERGQCWSCATTPTWTMRRSLGFSEFGATRSVRPRPGLCLSCVPRSRLRRRRPPAGRTGHDKRNQ